MKVKAGRPAGTQCAYVVGHVMGKARNLADSFLYDRDLRHERVYFHPRDF